MICSFVCEGSRRRCWCEGAELEGVVVLGRGAGEGSDVWVGGGGREDGSGKIAVGGWKC